MLDVGRNRPCPCGSGKKYKLCCMPEEYRVRKGVPAGIRPPPSRQPILAPPAPFTVISPRELRYSDELWERFEAVEGPEEGMQAFREALGRGVLDSGDALEMLGAIHDELSTPEQHRAHLELIEEFRKRDPKLYEEGAGYHNSTLILDALQRQGFAVLPELLEPYAQHPERYLHELSALIPPLMYHGQRRPLLDLLRRVWPTVRQSKLLSHDSVVRFRENLLGLVVLEYVDAAPAPRPDDPELETALRGIGKGDEIRSRLICLLGQMPEALRPDLFSHDVPEQVRTANLERLTGEWLGDLRRRHGVPLVRGELARRVLLKYLQARAQQGVTGRRLLVPSAESLCRHLGTELLDDMHQPARLYEVGTLLELLPLYPGWLVDRGLVAQEDIGHALDGMGAAQQSLRRGLEEDSDDPATIQAFDEISKAVREADPRWGEDAASALDPRLAQLLQAGKDPDPSLFGQITALGAAMVPQLVAIAVDERLHFSSSEGTEVWAPLHAIRLLGELEAAQAVEPLLSLVEWDDEWLDEYLSEAFGRIGRPAFEPLRVLAGDRELDAGSRGRAAQGLTRIAKYHPDLRSEVVTALVALLDPAETRTDDDTTVNGFIISHLAHLKADEALPAIRRAFDQGLVDQFIIRYDDVLRGLGLAPPLSTSPPLPATPAPRAAAPVPRAERKIGRNDPCSCGSGKKYKKCHGR